jgi:hypothetical protein
VSVVHDLMPNVNRRPVMLERQLDRLDSALHAGTKPPRRRKQNPLHHRAHRSRAPKKARLSRAATHADRSGSPNGNHLKVTRAEGAPDRSTRLEVQSTSSRKGAQRRRSMEEARGSGGSSPRASPKLLTAG